MIQKSLIGAMHPHALLPRCADVVQTPSLWQQARPRRRGNGRGGGSDRSFFLLVHEQAFRFIRVHSRFKIISQICCVLVRKQNFTHTGRLSLKNFHQAVWYDRTNLLITLRSLRSLCKIFPMTPSPTQAHLFFITHHASLSHCVAPAHW